MTPKSIRTDIICMNHPPRVQRGHIRRPGHSAGRAVRDGYTCLGIGRDCSGWNYDGGLGIRRGCDRRMRSSSLATAPIVSSIGRQKRSAAEQTFPSWENRKDRSEQARREPAQMTPLRPGAQRLLRFYMNSNLHRVRAVSRSGYTTTRLALSATLHALQAAGV